MRIITGFMPATAGTVKVAGYDIFDDSTRSANASATCPKIRPCTTT